MEEGGGERGWVVEMKLGGMCEGVVTPFSFLHSDGRCLGLPWSDQPVFRKEAGDSGTLGCSCSLLRFFL